MRLGLIVATLAAGLVAGCAAGTSPFEDRSDEVRIHHRVPSK